MSTRLYEPAAGRPGRWRAAVRWHPALMALAGVMVLETVVAAVGVAVDPRILVGVPIWTKPLKFAISVALYAVSWSWMISLLHRGRRVARWTGTAVSVLIAVEMVIITVQVVRGQQSHFNFTTPFNGTLFVIMGGTIGVVWLGTLVLSVLVLRQRVGSPAKDSALRLGSVLSLVGIAEGFLMVGPTQDQVRTMAQGGPRVVGAHSVGVPDGGPGLPLLGWSTTGGDLRVPHFVGIHALQVLPLVLWLVTALAARVPVLRDGLAQRALVRVAGAGYLGLMAITTWQALRGQPLIHPDGWTLVAVAAVLAGCAAGVTATVTSARRRAAETGGENAADRVAEDRAVAESAR